MTSYIAAARKSYYFAIAAAILALCSAGLIVTALAWPVDAPGSMPGNHAVPAMNPDPRIEYDQFSVGGLMLCNPNMRDSTGQSPCVRIPLGSILVVPRTVVNPDSTRGAE